MAMNVFRRCLGIPATLLLASFTDRYWKGADIGWVTQYGVNGRHFFSARGEQHECTALMKEFGPDAVRFRSSSETCWSRPSGYLTWVWAKWRVFTTIISGLTRRCRIYLPHGATKHTFIGNRNAGRLNTDT